MMDPNVFVLILLKSLFWKEVFLWFFLSFTVQNEGLTLVSWFHIDLLKLGRFCVFNLHWEWFNWISRYFSIKLLKWKHLYSNIFCKEGQAEQEQKKTFETFIEGMVRSNWTVLLIASHFQKFWRLSWLRVRARRRVCLRTPVRAHLLSAIRS